MKYIKILILFLSLTLVSFNSAHEYYVSVTEIEHVKEKKAIQIITRVFIDDFEKLLRKRYDENLMLGEGKNETMADKYIERYLRTKFIIKVNGEEIKYDFLGKEYEDDIVYFYLEITNVEAINSFEIKNQMLFEMFPDQQNIVKTKMNGEFKSFILIPRKDTRVLNFN